jgi:hypothetical protein
VTDVALVVDLKEGFHNSSIINLLVFADLPTSGITGDLDVTDELVVLLNSADEISIHDLHVISVK